MFDVLTEKLNSIFARLGAKGRLTDKDVDEALREVRMALLEADVNYKVARRFVNQVRERAVAIEVLQNLSPGQQVIKIVNEEMTAVLGGGNRKLEPLPSSPSPILLVGLQGSGKTTTAAKLGLHLTRQGQKVLLVAADLRRAAAVEQLVLLGKQLDLPTYSESSSSTTVKVAANGMEKARGMGAMWAIVDTGGRMHVDDILMEELISVRQAIQPAEVLLVVDAMTGQDAVTAALEFHKSVGITGLILSKLDGDARGGAALSITEATGVPVKFVGVGEKPDALEPFYPDRMASRILGMGDVLSLIEKAQHEVSQERAAELGKKLRKAQFDLADFLEQLQALKRMGPLQSILEMLPGFGSLKSKLPAGATDERHLKKVEAIIYSMTPQERRTPAIIDGSRRRRIAAGSGTVPQDINQLLNQFRQAQKLMKQFASGGSSSILKMLR